MEDDWRDDRTPSPLHRTGTLTSAEAAGAGQAMGSPLELPDDADVSGGEGLAGNAVVCENDATCAAFDEQLRPDWRCCKLVPRTMRGCCACNGGRAGCIGRCISVGDWLNMSRDALQAQSGMQAAGRCCCRRCSSRRRPRGRPMHRRWLSVLP